MKSSRVVSVLKQVGVVLLFLIYMISMSVLGVFFVPIGG